MKEILHKADSIETFQNLIFLKKNFIRVFAQACNKKKSVKISARLMMELESRSDVPLGRSLGSFLGPGSAGGDGS